MIHFITMALGGDGYLNFMGNEVVLYEIKETGSFFGGGRGEWIDPLFFLYIKCIMSIYVIDVKL
jgi:hypothetical protein